jgi:precorrin-6B methylase 2
MTMLFDDSIPGWMTSADLQSITGLATLVPENGVLVEIGSLFGRSTVAWAMSCHPSVNIYCGDHFYEHYIDNHDLAHTFAPISGHCYNAWLEFNKNTNKFPNVVAMRGKAPDESNYPGHEIDLLFVDALHKNPNDWEIIKYFAQFVKVGGIISGHDFRGDYPDVINNVNRLASIYNTPINSFESTHSSIWSMTVTKEYNKLDFES